MAKWTSSTGNTVNILPWTDCGFKFITLECEEYLGGKVASGSIKFIHGGNDKALKMITSENKVEIEFGTESEGRIMKISGIITARTFYKNMFEIGFNCVPDKDFYTTRDFLAYDDIDTAIKSLWKGELDIRTSSDLPGSIKFNQAGEFNHKYLWKLCAGYKKETVAAFGLEGLLIKDLIGIDSTGHQEPYWGLTGNGENLITNDNGKFRLFYDHKLYKKPEDPWEGDSLKSLNLEATIFNNSYTLTHKDTRILQENMENNNKIYTSKMYNQIHLFYTTQFQIQKLGDVVYYRPSSSDSEDTLPFKKYIISHIKYYIRTEPDPDGTTSDFPFKVSYTMHCLEENGETMNDQDPQES